MKTTLGYIMTAITFAAMMTQYASASGLGWVLYGNVIDASTCNAIAGARISSPYNNYASNMTNSYGSYRLILGSGNWSVTVGAAGYNNGSYLTPYYSTGAWQHNFSLVPTGGMARSTPCFGQTTTVVNATTTTITPGVGANQTSTTVYVAPPSQAPASTQSSNSSTWIIGGIVVVLIIAGIAYYLSKNGKKEKPAHSESK
ncbi:MAG: hypothetical protein ACHQX1_02200 [Candidatus Micrarchaeales archaeon]